MSPGIPLAGKLDENNLPRLLSHIHEIKSTGTLALLRDGVNKKLFIKNGDIIFASSTYEGDRLGEILLKTGKITLSQFDAASKVVIQTGKRMGGVLVELGHLKPKDLFWGVKYQVQEIVASLFDWTDGDYEFTAGELPASEVITLHMSTANLILQGIKRIDDWTRISRGVPPMKSVLAITANPLKLYQDIGLSEGERTMLSLFDGKKSIKEVFSLSKMGDFDALKAVYTFYSIGMLEEAGASAPAGKKAGTAKGADIGPTPGLEKTAVHKAYIDSKSQNYYELLHIDTEATSVEVEEAYLKMAKTYHPDQQFKAGMQQLKGELEELFNSLTEAYNILSDDSRRWEYDLSLATVMQGKSGTGYKKAKDPAKAKEAFSKGIASFKAKDLESATVHFKEATRLDASNAGYYSHLALALLQRPKRESEAEEAMLAAIELEPGNADHRANLGLLYQRAGIKDKSKKSFEEALKIDPRNDKALKGLGRKK